ncbi:MAG TPA: redox-sensing transcriptional repressor Rex [Gemmatimonadota bacterium]|nr:redox-sensing transcriptional repressor Rex [Gemmatimonadota bacterium]
MTTRKISESAVRRLSHYLRFLDEFEATGATTVSSDDLAEKGGMTSAQVRKDLSRFGSFGKRGLGYPVDELRERLRQILGLDRRWRVCLAGAGRLGAALYQYEGFRRQGFDFVAVFDRDPAKIGRRWGDLEVEDVARLAKVVADKGIEMGVIVTPRESAQEVADRLVGAGVEAILNFAPRKLSVPAGVTLRDVNLAIEIEGLSFALTHAGEIVTAG